MSAATATEFNPEYFKSIFGDDAEDWKEFIQVNLNTYRDGYAKLQEAVEANNLAQIKEIRHALSPTLQQWNATTLERELMALDSDNLAVKWPPLKPEFEALLTAFHGL